MEPELDELAELLAELTSREDAEEAEPTDPAEPVETGSSVLMTMAPKGRDCGCACVDLRPTTTLLAWAAGEILVTVVTAGGERVREIAAGALTGLTTGIGVWGSLTWMVVEVDGRKVGWDLIACITDNGMPEVLSDGALGEDFVAVGRLKGMLGGGSWILGGGLEVEEEPRCCRDWKGNGFRVRMFGGATAILELGVFSGCLRARCRNEVVGRDGSC